MLEKFAISARSFYRKLLRRSIGIGPLWPTKMTSSPTSLCKEHRRCSCAYSGKWFWKLTESVQLLTSNFYIKCVILDFNSKFQDSWANWCQTTVSSPEKILRLSRVRVCKFRRWPACQQVRWCHQRHDVEIQHHHHWQISSLLGIIFSSLAFPS